MKKLIRRLRANLCNQPDRQRRQSGKNAGIAKILIGGGPDHAGMGILITPQYLMTCAHVVNTALNLEPSKRERPTGTVNVAFPMLASPTTIHATIKRWRGPGETPQSDIALLRLERAVPEAVGVAMLANVAGMSPDGDELSIFGIAGGHRLGIHVGAKFRGSTSEAWVQIDGVNRLNPFVEVGFSGAAVWDHTHSAVLGMVVAKSLSDTQDVAYMIPTSDLNRFWPHLQIEHRPLSASFARTWTILSAIYLLLILSHWAWDRGVEAFSVLTLARDHKHLASFWGMHIYALLAPFILGMLIAFSRSFRLHNWIPRVPSFGTVRASPTSSSTSRTAALSLAAFVILPLAAQIHFLSQFHDKGDVYIYPDSFGYSADKLEAMGWTCFRNDAHLCTNGEIDRYTVAVPAVGNAAGYWTNDYQFGDRSKGDRSTVTYFPRLQPIIVLALTAVSAAMSAIALLLVFRRTPEQLIRRKIAARKYPEPARPG